jgi:hypothetical protein
VVVLWSGWLFFTAWRYLRSFLSRLSDLPLQGAFQRLPREFSAAPIWKDSPGRRNFALFFRGLECMRDLHRKHAEGAVKAQLRKHLDKLEDRALHIQRSERQEERENFPSVAAAAAAAATYVMYGILKPEWESGRTDPVRKPSETPEPLTPADEIYHLAAEFVALRYAAPIRYAMLQFRNLIWFVAGGFVLLALAMNSFDPQEPELLRWCLTVAFAVLGFFTVQPLLQMEKDKMLCLLAETKSGEHSAELIFKIVSYGLGPLLGILSAYFPTMSRFLFSWLQPTLETLK